jgi:hypothetical protein
LVCLLGPAGTGKTLLAIGAAIHHTRQQLSRTAVKAAEGEGKEERLTRRQRKQLRTQEEKLANGQETERLQIYITRPQVSMGKEMGLLPLAVRSNSTRQTRGAGSRAQRLLGRGFRRGGAGHASQKNPSDAKQSGFAGGGTRARCRSTKQISRSEWREPRLSRGLPFERCELIVRKRWRRRHQQHDAEGEAEVSRSIQSDSSSHPLPTAPTGGKAA